MNILIRECDNSNFNLLMIEFDLRSKADEMLYQFVKKYNSTFNGE